MPIDEVDVRLSGPGDPVSGDCAVGTEGERTPCPADVASGGELSASAEGLEPGEGMTVSASFPTGAFAGAEPVLENSYSPALAFSVTPATVGAGLAGLLLLTIPAIVRARRGRDRPEHGGARPWDASAPQLTPPQDARPGQLGTVVDGYAQRHEVTATLLDLAVRGFLRIEEVDDPDTERGVEDPPTDWRLVRSFPRSPSSLRSYEQELLDAVFADGDEVVLSDLQSSLAATQTQVCASMYRDVVELGWFHSDPAATRRRWYVIGAAVLTAGAALTIVLAIITTWALTGIGVGLAGLVILALAGRMPTRTSAGAQVRRRTQAFRDQLATTDLQRLPRPERVAALADDAHTDVASRYLPYAVALGVAEEWEEVLRRSGPQPAPVWYITTYPSGATGGWPGVFAFSSPSNPALAPPARSSGAGATSVGGAAGGGGGGSW